MYLHVLYLLMLQNCLLLTIYLTYYTINLSATRYVQAKYQYDTSMAVFIFLYKGPLWVGKKLKVCVLERRLQNKQHVKE